MPVSWSRKVAFTQVIVSLCLLISAASAVALEPQYLEPPVIVVSEDVRSTWTGVVLTVEDKAGGSASNVNVRIEGEYPIPGTDIEVLVHEFLPDFRMDGMRISSATNEPNNPSVRVEILVAGKTDFSGWLYAKFPSIHPFQHERYSVVLKEGIMVAQSQADGFEFAGHPLTGTQEGNGGMMDGPEGGMNKGANMHK